MGHQQPPTRITTTDSSIVEEIINSSNNTVSTLDNSQYINISNNVDRCINKNCCSSRERGRPLIT